MNRREMGAQDSSARLASARLQHGDSLFRTYKLVTNPKEEPW